MEEKNVNLKTGDLVTFFSEQEEEDGYFSKSHDSAVMSNNKSKDCVFKIYPFTQYTARKALKKKAKRKLQQQQTDGADNGASGGGGSSNNNNSSNSNNNNGITNANGENANNEVTDLELKQLEEYQDLEDVSNESTLIQLEGRDLVYGQIVQLYQPSSNQFLFARNNLVGFRQDGSQKCYFKITPRFQNQDGCKVFSEDLVLLRHEKTGLFLNQQNFIIDQGVFGIGLSENGTFWKMAVSDVDGKSGLNILKANEPFRLFHREGGFVKVSNDKTTFTYNTKTPSSINSLFEIEFENNNLVSPLLRSQKDKENTDQQQKDKEKDKENPLKQSYGSLSASNTITPSPSSNNNNNNNNINNNTNSNNNTNNNQIFTSNEVHIGQSFWIRLVGTKKYLSLKETADDGLKENPLIVVPEDQKYSPSATFSFVKRDKANEDVVFGSFVRIQSLSKQYLHFISDETFHHNGELVGSKKYYKNDDFQIKQIPKSQLEDYGFVLSRINKIQNYLYQSTSNSSTSLMSSINGINQSGFSSLVGTTTNSGNIDKKRTTIQEIKIIIVEFIKFCTQSEVEDPLDREGTPIKTHQKLLSHPSHLSILLEYLRRLFEPFDPASILFIYRLLKQMVKSNIKNGIIINEHLDQISPPLIREKTIPLHFGAILYEVYKNNNILLEALTEDKVQEFINVIKQKKEPKYMELLSEICICYGKPIVKNQQYLCDLLLEKNSNLLFKTRVIGGSLEIEKQYPTPKWVDITAFALSVDEKTHRYFEQSLALYANVSKGRNYNGIRLVGQRITHKECLLALKEESLPYSLRGCYINILIHVYMDCHPQHYVPQINYVWNPSIVNNTKTTELLQLYQQYNVGTGSLNQRNSSIQNPYNTISTGNISISSNNPTNIAAVGSGSGFMPTVGPSYGQASSPLTNGAIVNSLTSTTNINQAPPSLNLFNLNNPTNNTTTNNNATTNNTTTNNVTNNNNTNSLITSTTHLIQSTSPQQNNTLGSIPTSPVVGSTNHGGQLFHSSSQPPLYQQPQQQQQNSLLLFREDDIFSTFVNLEIQADKEPSTTTQLLISLLSKSEYFSNFNNGFPTSHRPQLAFFHKILIAVGYAFKFGFFRKKERVLLKRLRYILEFEHEPVNTFKEVDLGRTMGGSRMLEDESVIYVSIKIEIVNILHLMLSFQKKNIMDVFLYDFSNMSQSAFSQPENVKNLLMEKLTSSYQRDSHQDLSLCTVLFKLLKHENNQLSSLSLSLLNRIYKYRSIYAMLWSPIQKLFLLPNELTPTYKESLQKMESLTVTCFAPLSDDSTQESLRSLAFFIHLVTDSDPVKLVKNQKLLHVISVHKTIIGVLKIGCSLDDLILDQSQPQPTQQQQQQQPQTPINLSGSIEESPTTTTTTTTSTTSTTNNSSQSINFKSLLNSKTNSQSIHVAKIFRSCYEFLKVFCRDNRENQKVLFGEIEFLIGHLIRYGNVFGTVETLIEVFKNNIELAISFGNSPYLKLLVKFIINLSIDQLDPMFLRLLSVLILPCSENSVIENQISVTNLLKEYKSKISKLLIPIGTMKDVMKDPKLLSKHYNVNSSNVYKLHLALQEILNHSLNDDGASIGSGGSIIGGAITQSNITTTASVVNSNTTNTTTTNNTNNNNNSNNNNNNNNSNNNNNGSFISHRHSNSITQSVHPRLIRSSAKAQIINSSVEILPKEFVINLELILLLKACSHGINTPTEVICREFLSMGECFDILIVRSDGNGKENSSLMINDTKEYLENNLLFRFKSAYLSFLHEVFFNSDTLKGDLLALQLNHDLWSLIDQFTNQLNHLFTISAMNQMGQMYYVQISRNIIMPMVSVLERFYSQCFYFDKATQIHLTYSGRLMTSLMKLYWKDPSLTIPFTQQNTSRYQSSANMSNYDDNDTSEGGYHPILQGLEPEEKVNIYSSLVKCLKAMDRSALSPIVPANVSTINISNVIKGCEDVINRTEHPHSRNRTETIDSSNSSPLIQSKPSSIYIDYTRLNNFVKLAKIRGYTEIAMMVNQSLSITPFIISHSNYNSSSYYNNGNNGNGNGNSNGGNGTIRSNSYGSTTKRRISSRNNSNISDSNKAGSTISNRFQNSLSNTFSQQQQIGINNQRHINIGNGPTIGTTVTSKSTNFLEILVFQLRNSLYNNDEMKINCIRILSSLLYINKERKPDIQNIMTDLYCHSAVIGLLSSKNIEIQFESLSLLLALLEDSVNIDNPLPNPKVKDDIQSHFSSSPDIQFFRDIYAMIERAKINLRDTKRNIHRIEYVKMGNNTVLGGNLTSKNSIKSSLNQNQHNNNNRHSRIVDVNADSNPYSTEFQLLQNIFRVLQLLCQGTTNILKKSIRSQPDNYKSYDILKEMCQFLKILETIVNIDSDSIELGLRFFACMKEIVKNTPENQIAVTNVQVCKAVCNILKKPKENDPSKEFKELKYLDLKIEVVDFLLHVIDKEDPRVMSKLIPELDYKVIESNTQVISQRSNHETNEKSIKLASMTFRLIKILADNDKSQNLQLEDCLLKCGEHCKSRIGRVELLYQNKLERIYFPIPNYSRRLILEDKEQSKIKNDENLLQENLEEHFINNKISWNKATEKIDAFMDYSEYKLIELEHLHNLKLNSMSYYLVSHTDKFKFLSFFLALIINLLLVIYSINSPPDLQQFKSDISDDYGIASWWAGFLPLTILQTICCVLACVGFFLRKGPVLLYQNWVNYLKTHGHKKNFMFYTNDQRMYSLRQTFKYKFIPLNVKFIMTDLKAVYNILAVICSVLGIIYSPYFFAFHIFQFSLNTKALSLVLKAITMNKKTLLVMGVFILQAIYLLSIFSFVWFQEHYADDDSQYMCGSLLQCFITNLYYGVPSQGQLIQFIKYKFPNTYLNDTATSASMEQVRSSNTVAARIIGWTVFNVAFYVVISLILLNVILGIIVDTFGQLRDQRAETEDYKSNVCFICSIERETFQKNSIEFKKHIEDDHNKWHYLYFFAYLKERCTNNQMNQLSELECSIADGITNRNYISFFPIEMSMSLQGIENANRKKEESIDQHAKLLDDLEKKITHNISTQLNQSISLLIDEIKNLRQQVSDLKQQK
ncbi:hypothetical protein RB653_003929 [Dictyostelium firmibasis]|uniref:Uncharacterized protein n=1 Tax=Dictyostelium firmibasis TaxID=79012 RepID=A0AAN7YWK4_9MYCE